MIMMMAAQQEGAGEIDGQADGRDDHRLPIFDPNRADQPLR
jgi:hypothetical protein